MRKLAIDRVCGHTFVSSFLEQQPTVLDLGANHGAFSSYLRERYNATVVAAEPVPDLHRALPAHPLMTNWQVAIAGKTGSVTLYLNQRTCATLEKGLSEHDADGVQVNAVALSDFLEHYTGGKFIDLLKLDIEGAEIEALMGLDRAALRRVGMLTVEFHDFCLPDLGPGVRRCMRWVKSQGFYCVRWSMRNTDVLFINSEHHELSWTDKTRLHYLKWARGLARKLALVVN